MIRNEFRAPSGAHGFKIFAPDRTVQTGLVTAKVMEVPIVDGFALHWLGTDMQQLPGAPVVIGEAPMFRSFLLILLTSPLVTSRREPLSQSPS